MAQPNPIAALRAAIQARANAAVRLGQSPLSAAILANRGDNYLRDAGQFLVANSTGNEDGTNGWISAQGLVATALHICNHSPDYSRLNTELRNALTYGALTALWIHPTNTIFTPVLRDTARTFILRMIASTPPTAGQLTKTIRQYIQVINTGRLDYIHQCCAHLFPLELLPEGVDQGLIDRLRDFCYDRDHLDNARVDAITAEESVAMTAPSQNDVIRTVWINMTEAQVIAYFSVMASESTTFENVIDCPTLQEVERVDVQTLVQYSNIFQRNITDYRRKVSALVYNHQLVKSAGLDTLTRILQQSRVPHVAGFNAVCELVTRYQSVTYTTLSSWFGVSQVRRVAQLAATLIHNPYKMLTGPSITVAHYPDIAFLATEIMYNARRQGSQQRDRSISPAEGKITKSVVYIRNLATGITGIETSQLTADTTISFILGAYNLEHVQTTAEGNIVYRPMVAPNLDAVGDQTIRPDQLPGLLTSRLNNNDMAFRNLIETAMRQLEMSPIPDVNLEGDMAAIAETVTSTPLNDALTAHLQTLGVTLDNEWTRAQVMIHTSLYATYIAPRTLALVNTHRNAGAAPNN
uniref:Uncharacterized protein n=1 Tax=Glossina morsitans morsitans TaxID=37546 RepID=A0A1B0GBC4_GLOMM